MKHTGSSPLNRLLRPRSIVAIGGKFAERAIRQCDLMGYEGEIWPVNPHRDEMYFRPCFRSLEELPGVPDAAFVAVPNQQTVEIVRELAAMGAGGAVCYAAGFAEVGGQGMNYQKALDEAMGNMPLIGPNCYGVLNYQDGVALWPDEQGGSRCQQGVAIISQSGNITVSLTMQRRGLPVAYLISTGNMTGVKTHDYIHAMLENPGVTAIGLYLEGLVDAHEFSIAAIAALKKGVPIVVLESGQSEIGARVTRTHSFSLSSDSDVSRAFYRRYGIIQVESIPELLETLKLVSIIRPQANRKIASISCSGGEAALTADLAKKNDLEFAEFTDKQRTDLEAVLGDRVDISNPLDYHTYIWGNQVAQTACFQAVYQGSQHVTLSIIDIPMEGICDPLEWDYAVRAITDAKVASEANVVAVSTLHENFPLSYQSLMLDNGIPSMFGMVECLNAVAGSYEFAKKVDAAQLLKPLLKISPNQGETTSLTEFQGKNILRSAGFPVAEGVVVRGKDEGVEAASNLGYPVVAKMMSADTVHKSDSGGVILDIDSDAVLVDAYESITKLSDDVLIEKQLPAPVLEMLIGFRVDVKFGPLLVIGAGGKLANLIEDTAILHFPIIREEVEKSIEQLKIGKVLKGYRSVSGDFDAVIQFILDFADFAVDEMNQIAELEINPLFVYASGSSVQIADVVYRRFA